MTDEQKEKCHVIIHGASTGAGAVGAGMAQLPMADNAVIVPIQVGMVLALGKVFNVELTEAAGKGVVLGMAATFVGRAASQVLLGWVPFLGNAVNAATAAGLTEAMGWGVAKKFDRGEIKRG